MENKLPKGWKEVQLIQLLEVLESGSRPKGGVRGILNGIPSIGGEHLNNSGSFDFSNIKFVPNVFAGAMKRGKIETKDILIVKDGATTGKTSFVSYEFPYKTAFVNEHVFICRSSKEINAKYLFWFLRSNEGNKRIMENFKGSAQGGINQAFASNTFIPLAPLDEQHRIVTKLDTIMEKVERNKARLEKIPMILKSLRKSVLAAAVSGKLTKEWREKNKDIDWKYTPMRQVLINIQAGKSIKCDERPPKDNEIGIVKVSSVSWGEFLENESKTITDNKFYNENYLIEKGDFLFSRANTNELVGAVVIVEEIHKRLMLSDKILRFTFKDNILPKWILYFLQSKEGRNQIENLATGNQQSMMNIGQDRIRQINIPIPTMEEQEEIIKYVEGLFGVANKLEARFKQAKAYLDKLPQSILAKAFRGELVPQNLNDEPANVLLERIVHINQKVKMKNETKVHNY